MASMAEVKTDARLLELAERIERYDPKLSPDNRADELELHRDIVLATGEGSMNPERLEDTFVRSLDAAMTLVPKDWCRTITWLSANGEATTKLFRADNRDEPRGKAVTEPLALCAAALRARTPTTPERSDG